MLQAEPLPRSLGSRWRSGLIVLASCLVVLVMMFWPTTVSLVESWSKDPLAHGYFVLPGVLYLVWIRRRDLAALTPAPSFWVLPILGLLAVGWLLGVIADRGFIEQFCLLAMIAAFVSGILGWPVARALLFPLGGLVLALPLPDRFVPALQDFTARFTVTMLGASGVPASLSLQDHIISIPGSLWLVAGSCSGVHYLMSSLVLGYVYAGVAYRHWRYRVAFLLAASIIALVGNGLRVYGTILTFSLGHADLVEGTRHYLFGWVVFAAMMGVLLPTCGNWKERPANGQFTPARTPPNAVRGREFTLAFAMLGLLLVGTAPLFARLSWP
jgi:exosortase A